MSKLSFQWEQFESRPMYLSLYFIDGMQMGHIKYINNRYLLRLYDNIYLSLEELEEIVNKMKEMNKC